MNVQQPLTYMPRRPGEARPDPSPRIQNRIREAQGIGLLARGLRWLRERRLNSLHSRRLQVCATVPLGEKRFVSIIECDGLQYLIGGGAGNVCLLSQLPTAPAPAPNPIRPEGPR